jgi:hypothetical protein
MRVHRGIRHLNVNNNGFSQYFVVIYLEMLVIRDFYAELVHDRRTH